MTIETYKLESGARVILDKMNSVETVSIAILAGVGGRYEESEENGISHFLEHMAFKGTKKRSAIEIAEAFDSIGGSVNAYTSRERTVYYAKVLKEDVETGIDILSDILQNSVFDEEEIERERTVIIQEIAGTLDTPDDVVFDYFAETAYPDQPVGRTILGPKEKVEKFQKKDFVNYINKHYHADNIIISIAGNFDEKEIRKLVADYFKDIKKENSLNYEPANYQGGYFKKEKDLEQVNFLMGLKACSVKEEEKYYPLQILGGILGSGMSSRLFQEIREKRGLAYSTYAAPHCYDDTGTLFFYVGTSPDKLGEAVKVMCAEALKITADIKDSEMQKARTCYKAALLMADESSSSRAQRNAVRMHIYGKIVTNAEVLTKITSIEKEQVQDYAKELLTNAIPTIAALGKLGTLQDFDQIKESLKLTA